MNDYGECAVCGCRLTEETVAREYGTEEIRHDAYGGIWCKECTRKFDSIDWDEVAEKEMEGGE
jgi:hypothetical protein